MVARRRLLAAGAAGGAALFLPPGTRRAAAAELVGLLDPASIPKYVTELVIPRAMPPLTTSRASVDEYVISVRQFRQQILPPGHPRTTVWSYGSPAYPGTFSYPACTIEATVNRPVRVTWVNELVDRQDRYLPHLLPVDPTLHWANPGGGSDGRDLRPRFRSTPGPYAGPVPIVTHVHGAHTTDDSDGYPEAWYLPRARDIPDRFATFGSYYAEFRETFEQRHRTLWKPGSATFQYPNAQRATALWYHDHSLGLTRLNVYAGPAGFYLLRGGPSDLPAGVLPGPAPALNDPADKCHHEIPLIIQDRSFNADGSLFYPGSRPPIGGFTGPYIPHSDVPPLWNPAFLANTIVVNGRTWPVLNVEPRRYRLRILNACNSRMLILKIASKPATRPAGAILRFWLIGSDGGFLPRPVELERLLIGNAERADVVVDFSAVPEGTELYLVNEGPDEHFGGGEPGEDFAPADPATTGQVLKFQVGRQVGADTSIPPDQLHLPTFTPLGPASVTRRLTLNVQNSALPGAGLVAHRFGRVTGDGERRLLGWHDPVSDAPDLGATEIWEFQNFTPDAHPIHIHQVQFQVIGRGPDGSRRPARAERGFKDTVVALPGEITRVKARFDTPGRYVWHCQILEHEDNDMMRPYVVRDVPSGGVDTGDGASAAPNLAEAEAGVGVGATLLAAAALGGVLLTRRQSDAQAPADPPSAAGPPA
jgi:bilirubin oxidase